MYRYTTRNVYLHGQLSLYLYIDTTTFSSATSILRRTTLPAPPSYPLLPTQSTVNHAHAPATSSTSRRRRGPNFPPIAEDEAPVHSSKGLQVCRDVLRRSVNVTVHQFIYTSIDKVYNVKVTNATVVVWMKTGLQHSTTLRCITIHRPSRLIDSKFAHCLCSRPLTKFWPMPCIADSTSTTNKHTNKPTVPQYHADYALVHTTQRTMISRGMWYNNERK